MVEVGTDRDGGRKGAGVESLSLYGYPQCPYCQRVLLAIDALGLEIELRDTILDSHRREELFEALGRGTVPVLRIDGGGDGVMWLPESAEIVRYLEERFGSD